MLRKVGARGAPADRTSVFPGYDPDGCGEEKWEMSQVQVVKDGETDSEEAAGISMKEKL